MQSTGAASLRASHPLDPRGESTVLSKAVVRATDYLGLSNKIVGQIIGISDASVSRMRAGSYTLPLGSKQFELAQYLVRLFRSLDAMTGGDDAASQSWLRTPNIVLGGKPIDLMLTAQGLLTVLAYVDSRRAPI
jgi:hypothetical protein